jgi:hypothetical protein
LYPWGAMGVLLEPAGTPLDSCPLVLPWSPFELPWPVHELIWALFVPLRQIGIPCEPFLENPQKCCSRERAQVAFAIDSRCRIIGLQLIHGLPRLHRFCGLPGSGVINYGSGPSCGPGVMMTGVLITAPQVALRISL